MDWKEIEQFPGLRVNSLGVIQSVSEITVRTVKRNGLLYLSTPNLKGPGRKYTPIHRIVAEYFLPDFEPGSKVRHKSINCSDNSVDNLEIVTERKSRIRKLEDRVEALEKIIKELRG